MMARLRDEAEALAEALEFGLCDVRDAVAWADAWILREDVPHERLCDVSLASGRTPRAVMDLLHEFPGEPDRGAVDGLVLTILADRMRREPAPTAEVAWILNRMAHEGRLPDGHLCEVAWCARHELADADDLGITVEEVAANLRSALDAATASTPARWSIDLRPHRRGPSGATS
ncbi:hypothetical protein [Paludisphaera soli]|uniref:hypothetical protein n=1 Tax=Paludisphaera soli TaxID=2712865 RepID=UPI0013EE0380|nr:hypothetical protein [Paludisphaera soli]